MNPVCLPGVSQTAELRRRLEGLSIGLVTNPTGLDHELRRSGDILGGFCRVAALFGPEHGVYGDAQAGDQVEDGTDRRTGLPMYSLYGTRKKPTAEMLRGLDALVFDMQDVGLRWYTYLYTLSYVMEACAEHRLPLVVLDRPNPLGGDIIEGITLDPACSSFIGRFPVPGRFGLTIGEWARHLARLYVDGVDLTIIRLQGWQRDMLWPETGLPWVMPSPNLPTPDSVLAYAATALFEGTNLSEGRGTTHPFEIVGAPWLDADAAANHLNSLGLTGIRWRPLYFTPTFSKHAGQLCAGVQMHITDGSAAPFYEAGLRLFDWIRHHHGSQLELLPPWREGGLAPLKLITGSSRLSDGAPVDELLDQARSDRAAFGAASQPDRLYPAAAGTPGAVS